MGGNDRPVMSLVGKVMKSVNRRGDPVAIKKLIVEGIAQRKSGGYIPVDSVNNEWISVSDSEKKAQNFVHHTPTVEWRL